MVNLISIGKWFLIFLVSGLSLWAFIRGDALIGGLGFIVIGVVFWKIFAQKKQDLPQEQLDLIEMIERAQEYLISYFKISVDTNGSFRLHGHRPWGETEYRLVFVKEDNGETFYYPVTIDRVTGKFGEQTGISWSNINSVEHFLNLKPGLPTTSAAVSLDALEELMRQQSEKFEEDVQDALLKAREIKQGGA